MMQDALQLGEMPSLSHSDLVEVSSEATESEDESSTTQDWSPSDITSPPDSDSEELEVVPAVTESEAVRLLAARIPPELFDNILFYVNVHSRSRTYLERNRGGRTSRDMPNDLIQCSLVCLFWANRCRQHMFRDRTLQINSYEDAEIFRRYVVQGCPRFTPVYQLIKHIRVHHNYSCAGASKDHERQTSFLHLLYLPVIQDKLKYLDIEGPVPDSFNPAKLDTPHWGIPPSVVVPSSFLQNNIFVRDVHLASFHHVVKYTRHFTSATCIHFKRITWDGQTPTHSLPQASNEFTCQRRPCSLTINAWGGCTNSVHLALTAMMMNPNCPLHRLSDEERVLMIKFTTLLWSDEPAPDVVIRFAVSEQTTAMVLRPFHFVFEEAFAPTNRSASALSVVGMHAYIHMLNKLPANFDALVNHLRTHPTIRALILLFDSLDRLQNSVKPFVQVLALATENIELVLAYEMEKERKAVGVDLVTLEPNDHTNIWIDELSGNYWGGYLSSQILQRRLKKKKWISVH